MTDRRGLTLIELLVVIAIVGAIVAVGVPAVQAAREAARRTQCSSNLHQLGLGVLQFVDTRGGHFPWTYHGGATESWIVTCSSFLENVQDIRLCPDDPYGETRVTAAATTGSVAGTSYVINEFVAYPTPNSILNYNQLQQTSKLIILFEGAYSRTADDDHVHTSQWYAPGDIEHGLAWNTIISEINPQAHIDTANYLYADGHVDTIPLETIYSWFLQTAPPGLILPCQPNDWRGFQVDSDRRK